MTINGKDNRSFCLVPGASQMTGVTAWTPMAAGQPSPDLDKAFHSANISTLGTDYNGESKIGDKKKLSSICLSRRR